MANTNTSLDRQLTREKGDEIVKERRRERKHGKNKRPKQKRRSRSNSNSSVRRSSKRYYDDDDSSSSYSDLSYHSYQRAKGKKRARSSSSLSLSTTTTQSPLSYSDRNKNHRHHDRKRTRSTTDNDENQSLSMDDDNIHRKQSDRRQGSSKKQRHNRHRSTRSSPNVTIHEHHDQASRKRKKKSSRRKYSYYKDQHNRYSSSPNPTRRDNYRHHHNRDDRSRRSNLDRRRRKRGDHNRHYRDDDDHTSPSQHVDHHQHYHHDASRRHYSVVSEDEAPSGTIGNEETTTTSTVAQATISLPSDLHLSSFAVRPPLHQQHAKLHSQNQPKVENSHYDAFRNEKKAGNFASRRDVRDVDNSHHDTNSDDDTFHVNKPSKRRRRRRGRNSSQNRHDRSTTEHRHYDDYSHQRKKRNKKRQTQKHDIRDINKKSKDDRKGSKRYSSHKKKRSDKKNHKNDYHPSTRQRRRHRHSYSPSFSLSPSSSFSSPSSSLSQQSSRQEDVTNSQQAKDDSYGHFEGGSGAILGHRYQIIQDVGMGTFGRVVQAIDLKHPLEASSSSHNYHTHQQHTCPLPLSSSSSSPYVAIKIIRGIQRYYDSALIEADILKDVNNRRDIYGRGRGKSHIVQMLDTFEMSSSSPYDCGNGRHACLVFECLGKSLYDFMKQHEYQPFPLPCVRDFARQLLEALEFLHSFGLIHTDLKPENILLVSNDEIRSPSSHRWNQNHQKQKSSRSNHSYTIVPRSTRIKVIDFGGSTYDNDEKKSTIVNTRQYRAPEVILGLGWSLPSDLWSAGCIIAELYTGELLFQTHDNVEHLALIEKVIAKFPVGMVSKSEMFRHVFNSHGVHKMKGLPPSGTSHVQKQEPLDAIGIIEHKRSAPAITTAGISDLISLLKCLLKIDPATRSTASRALNSMFFMRNEH